MTRKPKTVAVAPGIVMHFDGHDLFIIANGVKIAKRGHPNTPQARTWISLDPEFKAHGQYAWSYHSVGGRLQWPPSNRLWRSIIRSGSRQGSRGPAAQGYGVGE